MNLAELGLCLALAVGGHISFAADPGDNQAPQRSAPQIQIIASDDRRGSSIAVVIGDVPLVHTTQLLPLNQAGELVGGTNVVEQIGRVLANIGIVLRANESELARTIKLNVYLAQADALPQVEKVLAQTFTGIPEPATCFVIGELPFPGALVAMDAVAAAEPKIKKVTRLALYDQKGIQPGATLPPGGKIYVSGMADTNELPLATTKTLEKLIAAIGHLGLDKKHIVQLKAFLQPMSAAAMVREKIADFFQGHAPPVVLVEWISPSPNPPIEIELIAAANRDLSHETNMLSFLRPPGTTSTKVFSRVVRINHGRVIYFSGLYGRSLNDPGAQTREIFQSIGSILKGVGSDFEHLVKATYYVSDDEASNKLNEIRPEFFNPEKPPAASKAKVKSTGFSNKPISLDMIAVTQ